MGNSTPARIARAALTKNITEEIEVRELSESFSMIDPVTGTISFEAPALAIAPNLTRTQFLATPIGAQAEKFTDNEPWCSWKLRQTMRSRIDFIVVLWFHHEKLTRVSLSHSSPSDGRSWADWSMEKETQRERKHEECLASWILDKRREFSWGKVWSGYDDRTAGSSIEIIYGKD